MTQQDIQTRDTIVATARRNHRRVLLKRDVREYMRTNDDVLLHRIILNLFVHQPVPQLFKPAKSKSVIYLLING